MGLALVLRWTAVIGTDIVIVTLLEEVQSLVVTLLEVESGYLLLVLIALVVEL
jgi:hypothetical protein